MTYTNITSDGGMDPRNAAHHRVMVEAANTDAEIRRKLIDMGWTPPAGTIQVGARRTGRATLTAMAIAADQRDNAIRHLQALLNTQRTATQALQAEQEARQWLRSIGSEPT